jgi:guanylate kinase
MQGRAGLLFTLVGPAGAGKNRLMQDALTYIDNLKQLPTATTRGIRPNEQEGREHFYVTRERFLQMLDENLLLEHQLVHGNYYGIVRPPLEAALQQGQHLIADIDIFGAMRAAEAYPDNVVSVFIQPPSICTLVARMRERREKDPEIAKRLARVPLEMDYAPRCNYLIVNDEIDRAADKLVKILKGEISGQHIESEHSEVSLCDFKYQVEIVPVCQGETLRRVDPPGILTASIPPTELYPHRVALNALRDLLGTPVEVEKLVTGGQPDGEFLPPLAFECDEREDEEIITFRYGYRLDQPITPPAGWMWQREPVAPLVQG